MKKFKVYGLSLVLLAVGAAFATKGNAAPTATRYHQLTPTQCVIDNVCTSGTVPCGWIDYQLSNGKVCTQPLGATFQP